MIQFIYAIKDTKVPAFMAPVVCENEMVAKRYIATLVNGSQESPLTKYSSDYELYCLGQYDTNNGSIVSDVKFIINCGALKDGNSD